MLVTLNGQEALRVLATECPETGGEATCPALMFLDLTMPLMNGFNFLEAYRPRPLARARFLLTLLPIR